MASRGVYSVAGCSRYCMKLTGAGEWMCRELLTLPRTGAPLRGIAIKDPKSIGFCQLHQSRFVTLAAQLTVLCEQRCIDTSHGVIDRLVHTGVALFLTPSGGALA